MFTKTMTTDLIEQYLKKMGLPHQSAEESGQKQGVVFTMMPTGTGVYGFLIDPIVEQHLLRIRVPGILKAPLDETPADRLSGLLLTIAAFNYQLPMGGFGLDPRDGEVALNCGIPIDSNSLHFEDFQHALLMLGAALELCAADLKAVADGTKQAEDVVHQTQR